MKNPFHTAYNDRDDIELITSIIPPIHVTSEAGLIIEFKNSHHHHFISVENGK